MKALLSTFFLLLLFNSNAQYHPFPVDSTIWVNYAQHYTDFTFGLPNWQVTYVNNFCATGEDTVINAVDYKVIRTCHANGSDYFGAIRYETGRVYFVPNGDTNEGLIYDFTLNPGDSTTVLIMNPSEAQFATFQPTLVTVNTVDTVIVNGTPRKKVNVGSFGWIEGVGCVSGLFAEHWDNISQYGLGLHCMSVRDTIICENGWIKEIGTPGSCPFTLNVNDPLEDLQWTLFPNPANNVIEIHSGNAMQFEVQIYDAFGRLVLDNIKTEEEIYVGALQSGIYYAQIQRAADRTRLKFVLE